MTVKEALILGRKELEAGSSSAHLDARILLADVLAVSVPMLLMERERTLREDELTSYREMLELRRTGMPMAYILGTKEFMGLPFKVTEDTLIPRPDTEILVEEAIRVIRARGYHEVLDLCCGSGAIGLSVAAHLQFTSVTLSDINKGALRVTEANAKALDVMQRVRIVESDLFDAIDGTYDIVLSNPPYIREEERNALPPSVRDFEPHQALFGGQSGLEFYERIARDAREHLAPHGMLLVEIGYDQALEVKEIMKRYGYQDIHMLKDLAGHARVISCALVPET